MRAGSFFVRGDLEGRLGRRGRGEASGDLAVGQVHLEEAADVAPEVAWFGEGAADAG